jgi:hypothetical protein
MTKASIAMTESADTYSAKDRIFDSIKGFADVADEAYASTYGISQWFKAYLQSAEFANLEPKRKARAFEVYEGLLFILETIDGEKLEQS